MKLKIALLIGWTVLINSCKSQTNSTSKVTKTQLRVLIMDGENNHAIWPKTTVMLQDYLEETGLFKVDITRKAYTWKGEKLIEKFPLTPPIKTTPVKEPKYDPNFKPDFSNYDLVVSNLGWKASDLPDETKASFENYMANGGGLVVIHAADNAWGDWDEFNKMIGLGGWGGRNEITGPYVFYNDQNEVERDPSKGNCGQHGKQSEFILTTRVPEHPIMKGLPKEWLHAKDELYEKLRGPAENMTILATAYSDKKNDKNRTGRHEPMLMTINYKKGRVFHTTLGHMDYSMECVGFITTFQRGSEWAATGNVTQKVPQDFPNSDKISVRKWLP
ncbi:ThuA domain-containing protein [Algibacter sp. 2305UL17-15]|uniref:ThuA domain-containing protein n=1 Tax=Algibacter sp. 2305UL17-15 TaxID=3231268 RepID=UPI00345AD48D